MSKKNIKKIIIGLVIVIVLLICVGAFFMLKARNSKEIKIGMAKEEIVAILDKNKYKYDVNGKIIYVKDEVFIDDVKGSFNISFGDNGKVDSVHFLPSIDNFSSKELKETRDKIIEYLTKLYGETKNEIEDEGTLMYSKDEKIYAAFIYSISKYTQHMLIIWDEYQ